MLSISTAFNIQTRLLYSEFTSNTFVCNVCSTPCEVTTGKRIPFHCKHSHLTLEHKVCVLLLVCLCVCVSALSLSPRLLTKLTKRQTIYLWLICSAYVRTWVYQLGRMPECICVYMHGRVRGGFLLNIEIGQIDLCVCLGWCMLCKQALNIESCCNTNKNDIFLFSSCHFIGYFFDLGATGERIQWGAIREQVKEGACCVSRRHNNR